MFFLCFQLCRVFVNETKIEFYLPLGAQKEQLCLCFCRQKVNKVVLKLYFIFPLKKKRERNEYLEPSKTERTSECENGNEEDEDVMWVALCVIQ